MSTVQTIQDLITPYFPGLLGVQVLATGKDKVIASLAARRELCISGGILHGGAIMAFADTLGAIGTILNMPSGKRTITTNSSTNFIRAIKVNTMAVGECIPLDRNTSKMVWQTSIRSDSGKLCAVIVQTQLVLDSRPSADVLD